MTSPRALWLVPVAVLGLTLAHAPPRPAGATAEQAAPWEVAAPSADAAHDRARLLARLGADRWHAAGYRGRGVKVAVIDTGFRGWRSHLGSALPRAVLARSFRGDADLEARDSQHGILCGEVVHALAPDAELLFANWEPDRPETFVQAVAWAKRQGARVVSCSVIMPCWSDGEGGGPVHEALARVMGDGERPADLVGFACAGNIAQRHWTGPYRGNADGYHEWRPGYRDNGLVPWGDDERVSVELCWPAGGSYTVYVLDALTGAEIGRAPPRPPADGYCAVVRFQPKRNGQYLVRVRHTGGPAGAFHLAVLGGWLERFTERGSIPFPADGPEFAAVGAVEETGRRAEYSSCGPNSQLPKPDFVATVPFASEWRSKPFSGTSAAAPQAAALAALLLSRHPDWTPLHVRAALRLAAVDLAPPGHDDETGYGLLRLPARD
jgi:subtilisin family serine protease